MRAVSAPTPSLESTSSPSPWRTALALRRVATLPTVWTNVLAGVAFAADPSAGVVLPVALAASLLYFAGTFLNDAFDAKADAANRPDRPIPQGQVTARTVFAAGFGFMALGLAILWVGPGGDRAIAPGVALAALVVFYDVAHRKLALAPVILGLCRVAAYVVASRAAAPGLPPPLVVGALLILSCQVTLGVVARREAAEPTAPRRFDLLTAGLSLVDGAQLLALGHWGHPLLCVGAFLLARRLQRAVP